VGLDRTTRDAYLARLGLAVEPPSADALVRLHRGHAERVPYETLWIQLGDAWSTDAVAAAGRIAHEGRGGYCYHLNGGFSELLSTLGYAVTRHVGGVHGPDGVSESLMGNHLVLLVHDLPTDANPGGAWYVDVGLGDALHDPLSLVDGECTQGPYRLELAATAGAVGDWHLTHDPSGSFSGMAWWSTPTEITSFDGAHRHLSTSPESGFVRYLTVQRRDADSAEMLRGLALRRLGESGFEGTIESKAEFLGCLVDRFHLGLDHVPADALDAVWRRIKAAHDAWDAAGRP
jgi:N-hydroxyarylamine O-acetyltransferase